MNQAADQTLSKPATTNHSFKFLESPNQSNSKINSRAQVAEARKITKKLSERQIKQSR
jgi:hypothetical protein